LQNANVRQLIGSWHFWVALTRFGKDSLNECAESTGVESNAAASPLAVADQEVVEEAET